MDLNHNLSRPNLGQNSISDNGNVEQDVEIKSSDVTNTGQLVLTYDDVQGVKVLSSFQQELNAQFAGGFNSLPPVEQRISQTEWKIIQRQRMSNEIDIWKRMEIAKQKPPIRNKYSIIPANTFRYLVPPEMGIRVSEHKEIMMLCCGVDRQLYHHLQQKSRLSCDEIKNYCLRPSRVTYKRYKGAIYIDVNWETRPEIPTISGLHFTFQHHTLLYIGSGQLCDHKWMTIGITQLPYNVTPQVLHKALQDHLSKQAVVREIWQVLHNHNDTLGSITNEVRCLVELNLQKCTSITSSSGRYPYTWKEQLYPYIYLKGETERWVLELHFIGKDNWCTNCKEENLSRVEQHLFKDCPRLICKNCGSREHRSAACLSSRKKIKSTF